MDKQIIAAVLGGNETIAFPIAEPLNRTSRHSCSSIMGYFSMKEA
jgi:hypothetical protein